MITKAKRKGKSQHQRRERDRSPNQQPTWPDQGIQDEPCPKNQD